MEHLLHEAGDLVEGLRYLDDIDLINEDIVGCAANAKDIFTSTGSDTE